MLKEREGKRPLFFCEDQLGERPVSNRRTAGGNNQKPEGVTTFAIDVLCYNRQ